MMRNIRCGALAALLPLLLLAACATREGAEPATAATETKPPSPWDAARARGVAFRGIGNEPGWLVEVGADRQITMVTDFGASRVVLPASAPETVEGARTTFHVETAAHRLTLLLEAETCQDTMKGEIFPTTVTATLDGQAYHGCGRWLTGNQ